MRRPLCSKQAGRNIDVSLNQVSLKDASHLPDLVDLGLASSPRLQVDDFHHAYTGEDVVTGLHALGEVEMTQHGAKFIERDICISRAALDALKKLTMLCRLPCFAIGNKDVEAVEEGRTCEQERKMP